MNFKMKSLKRVFVVR
jgi:division protein CdvB (Snf7/Vps24/ESCRT-III family)